MWFFGAKLYEVIGLNFKECTIAVNGNTELLTIFLVL